MFDVKIGTILVGAQKTKITKILNNLWLADFELPNTAEYRELLGSGVKDVDISLAGTSLFSGKIISPNFRKGVIVVDCLQTCMYNLDRVLYTATHDGVSVNTIMSDICSKAGVTWGSSITYNRYLQYNKATALYAAIVACLHCDTLGVTGLYEDFLAATKEYGYYDRVIGTIWLSDPSPETVPPSGAYDNR